jgi:hypothetical protein
MAFRSESPQLGSKRFLFEYLNIRGAMTMKKLGAFFSVVILVMSLSLMGCGGGGAKVQASSTTLGQELVDLQEAYEKGIITEKEYNNLKKKVMKKEY